MLGFQKSSLVLPGLNIAPLLASAERRPWTPILLALFTELSIYDLQDVNCLLIRWCFWQFPFASVFESHVEKKVLQPKSARSPNDRLENGNGFVFFALQCFQPSTPSCIAPHPPSCLLNQMVRPNECSMISDEAFNMNSILTMVMMLILWTRTDDPM